MCIIASNIPKSALPKQETIEFNKLLIAVENVINRNK